MFTARSISLLLLLATPAWAGAQTTQPPASTPAQTPPPETRAEELRREREEKQMHLTPQQPNAVESAINLAEKKAMPFLQRDGVYAKLGSLTTSSGFAYGAGFRNRRLFNRHGTGDVWAAGAINHYWAVEGRMSYTPNPNGIVTVDGFIRRVHYPREEFFGVGPDSQRANRSDYKTSGVGSGVGVTVRPTKKFSVGGNVDYLTPRIGPGTAGDIPTTQTLFDETTAPGLDQKANFLRTAAFVQFDTRVPINARRGGWYGIQFDNYDDRTTGDFSFRMTQLEFRQYVNFLSERRVLAFRGWLATTDVNSGEQIPFYLMPSLGGNTTLRGFRALRFRGPNAMLLQAEYRFEIWAGLDAALFYDTGKVTDRRADLNFKSLEHDYGIGFRFNTDQGVILRIDAAFGSSDGRHLNIVFGSVF
jgi:outer membrane protein assembly factor BamA